ncbi:hypothetical protein E5P55_01125 [Candidatus Pinguicoccus supinus]|uniref:Enoyl reductase FAD binding domain-containing protein n=1 Tax=Candidatus Pinguicoccus supinus TaxID=2529394 RepID=A0A7T0BRT3_9BACT|nr:hypothetical protein E5P55_01125 [Candidatus Pinguicoccus supinus]
MISNFLEYKKSFLNLFGFYIKSVDYSLPVKLEFNSKNLIIL